MSCVMMFVCEWRTLIIWTMRSVCVCVCVNVPRGCCNGQWVSNGNQFPLTTHFSIFYETGGCICVCLWGDVIMWCSSQTMITETRQNTHHLKLLDTDGSLWLLTQPQIIRPRLNGLPVNHQILLSTSEDLSTAAQILFIFLKSCFMIYIYIAVYEFPSILIWASRYDQHEPVYK